MTKRVAILQSNYIPWKGYFDLIARVDEFIIYDEVQYTKNDWRNRNKIKTPNGVQWLTIPVTQGLDQRIMDVQVTDNRWRTKHWKSLEANYRKANCFSYGEELIAEEYHSSEVVSLSEINVGLICKICAGLEISTRISCSTDYSLKGDRNERLIDICRQTGADVYVSGPAAQSYLQVNEFRKQGVEVEWFDYSSYPDYPQLWGGFVHQVSVLDVLFNCGRNAAKFFKFVEA
ncbi:MAG: WbqC family protein [Pseudomonadota bacterium]